MGSKVSEIMPSKEISISDLANKTLAVDAFNQLYMFLTTIRQMDGTPLTDANGNITSHLVGLFSRFTKLMASGIKFIFVFDGETPELKAKERERRRKLKAEALEKFEEAKQKEDVAQMKKYASRTTVLTEDMIEEAKQLISALGIPIVQAPSEGEAQAAELVKQGHAYAVMSQDADSLLFASTRVVKNLSLGNKRKKPGSFGSNQISPQLISLSDALSELKLSQKQLIALAMLVGTDYNIGGIKGLGPKKALKLIIEKGEDLDSIFEEAKWSDQFDVSWKDVFKLFEECEVTDEYSLEFNVPNETRIRELLVEKHNFSENRINEALKTLSSASLSQKGLSEFF